MIGNSVVILSGVRTAIGDFGSSLKDKGASYLATEVGYQPKILGTAFLVM